nr:histone-lysine N-methyltransferase SUVR3-like [Coffea arabica]
MNNNNKREKTTINQNDSALIQCAELILPYLHPVDLASTSSTCKTLNKISNSITLRRSSDASRSLEKFPIPFINSIDNQSYSYFIYTGNQILSAAVQPRQPWDYDPDTRPDLINPGHCYDPFLFRVEGAKGCECERGCDRSSRCPCLDNVEFGAWECGPGCQCGSDCGNRVSQSGILVKLKIVKDRRTGWGLYAGEFIPKGQFICEYAGELLVTKEAQSRQQIYDQLASSGQLSPALLVVKEHLPSRDVCMRINVDATRVGNVARFINHSCDGGNLDTIILRSSGSVLPRICFFSSRDVQNNEELKFSYGDIRLKKQGLPCFCGSSCCFGVLPSENT